jgi:hypothetical protein
MKRAHREHRWIHEMAEIIGNRYGVTNLATEPPTRAPGYMKDIEFLTFSCRQA